MDISSVGGSDVHMGSMSASERSLMTRQDFLELLVAELTHQDPLEPMKNHEFLGQLATLQNLEATSALTDGIRDLQGFQELTSASALIGKLVRAVTEEFGEVVGRVDSVSVRNGAVRLMVNGIAVKIGQVTDITAL